MSPITRMIQSAALAHSLATVAELDRRRAATTDRDQISWLDSRLDWWSDTAARLAVELSEPAGVA